MSKFIYDKLGLALTEGFEGLRLTAYYDVHNILTIGYGHTGSDVYAGQIITQAQAEALLANDILTAANVVNEYVKWPIDQDQFDACVDFTFNDGQGAFERSTLLQCINKGDMVGAEAQFMLWVNSGGKRFDGLVRRRTAEVALFKQ